MRFRFDEGGMDVEVLIGIRSIQAAEPLIEELRHRCDQAGDVMSSPNQVTRWSALHHTVPVALLVRHQAELRGVVWLYYRRSFGVVLGLVKSGNLCGQGSMIARPDERRALLEMAARLLLRRPFAHTVLLSMGWGANPPDVPDLPVPGLRGGWHLREVRFRLDLTGGISATMDRLGRKMRRNLRYYRRRAVETLECRFLPSLTPEQRHAAVAALHAQGSHALTPRFAAETEAALLAAPGRFAMGLQDGTGRWLSYIAGWREADGTHIAWQLNADGHATSSLSTVMRAYLLEHEAGRDSPAIVFVGLTSEFWSRVCQPELCGDLLATRPGLLGGLARRLTALARPNGQIARLHARALAPPPGPVPDGGGAVHPVRAGT